MVKKINKTIYGAVIFQIALMMGMTVSFSYILNEASNAGATVGNSNQNGIQKVLLHALWILDKIVFNQNNFASALSQRDLKQGSYTCPIDKNGSICQEYPASDCAGQCSVSCLPTAADQTSVCKVGTCYDPVQGTCQTGAPQEACQQNGGKWFNDPYGNVAQCMPGCCLLGNSAYFLTSQQCARNANATGLKSDFRPEVNTEIGCLALSQTQEQGACVFEDNTGLQNTCKFTSKLNCQQDLKGKFYSGLLCSNSALNTNCKPQASISCIQGKDEVYWIDSCGNQENIYDANKVASFNNVNILSKNNSCSLSVGTNSLANQASCGNCNYLLGSICGTKTSTQKLSEPNANVVCKDISCIDENGKKRLNGESWCAYQSSTGTEKGAGGYLRATDTVGSRDFRESCINGEIKTDPCADYRNEICTQSQTTTPDGEISSAACRINLGYQCYDYNSKGKKDFCDQNPDCFIKHVQVTDSFVFDICAPKYTPGFDLTARGGSAASICSLATQTCTVVYVHQLFGGWKCKANCDCETPKFAEQMNDLCISLGDCGTKTNYLGDLSKNSRTIKDGRTGGPTLSSGYINGLVKDANEKLFKNNYIAAGDPSKLYAQLGIPGWLGQAQTPTDPTIGIRGVASMVSGMGGVMLWGLTHLAVGHAVLSSVGLMVPLQGPTLTGAPLGSVVNPTFGAISGAASGAAVGLAIVSFLIDFTGIGPGIPPELTYGLMAAGAIGGAIVGLQITGHSAVIGVLSTNPVGWIILAVVIIIIIILSILGIGKIKKINYTFQCNVWQPTPGGNKCSQCGSDGFPCSQYSCQSLGQTCQLVNEGTANPACVNMAPNDTSPPVITPYSGLLPDGYTANVVQNGVQIKASGNGGCISETYQPITFGILLNEYGQCAVSSNHTSSFDEMDQVLSAGLYLQNHSLPILVPSAESLGLESFDPNASADYNIYVRCQDKSGNANMNEYDINFCIKPGNDTTPASIIDSNPSFGTVAYNVTNIDESIITSEPAECNWDITDKVYNLMANNFSCQNNIENRTSLSLVSPSGWECNAQLPFAMSQNSSTYYVRCLDQPWLTGENVSKRNVNTQGYPLTFTRTKNPLNITSINVDGKNLTFGTAPASVEVDVKTSGGLDGTAKCSYIWGNSTIDFMDTWKTTSTQVFQSIYPGTITLPIVCQDSIGDVAQKTVHFKILLDTSAPEISRAYVQSGTLNIITNEKSSCYYSTDISQQCLFDMNNASQFNGVNIVSHTISFDTKNTYYIKCKDSFGNYPGTCNMIIRQGNYESQQL